VIDNPKEQNFISVVAYLHNNANDIQNFYSKVQSVLKEHFLNFEIIFVDDASTDDTIDNLKKIVQKHGALSIIHMSYFQGVEKTMWAGMDLAIGDFVYEFDTVIINYSLKMIMEIYWQILQNTDIVIASEKNSEKFMSRQFYKIFNKYASIQYELGTERFHILSRRAINRIEKMSEQLPYRKAAYSTAGLSLKRIHYEKMLDVEIASSGQGKIKFALNNLILFTDFFYKWSLRIAIITMLVTIFVIIYTIVTFFVQKTIAGWTTTMLFMSFGFLGTFLFLTMVIKYMDVLIHLIFNKQKYLIKEIEKIY